MKKLVVVVSCLIALSACKEVELQQSAGPQGSQGVAGKDGTSGTNGTNGVGTKGDKGDKGDSGASVKGDKGDKGDKGELGLSIKGDKGDKGEKGDKGDSGGSLTEIVLVNKVCTLLPTGTYGYLYNDSIKLYTDSLCKVQFAELHGDDVTVYAQGYLYNQDVILGNVLAIIKLK